MWTKLVQVCGNFQGRVSGVCTQGRTTHGRRRGGGSGWSECEAFGVFVEAFKDKVKGGKYSN